MTTGAPASAAAASLTVATYDRTGAKVAAKLHLVNTETNNNYTATGNKAKALPKGTYAVLADIWTSHDQTQTIGGQIVTVSGTTRSTIDARRGRALRISLDKDPGAVFDREMSARICLRDSLTTLDGWGAPGKLFVIPNGSRLLRFAYSAAWVAPDAHESYVVAGRTGATVPTAMGHTFRTASLATVKGAFKSGPTVAEYADLTLTEQGSCATSGHNISSVDFPGTTTVHASAGTWELGGFLNAFKETGESTNLGYMLPHTFTAAAGRSYRQSYFNSAWGPAWDLPVLRNGGIEFLSESMFSDPIMGAEGMDDVQRSRITLYDARHRVVKARWRTNQGGRWSAAPFSARTKTKGWYTLQVNARRQRQPGLRIPVAPLSPRTDAVFHLKIDPKGAPRFADVILPRMVPAGLSPTNSAAPGTSTVVSIRPDRHRVYEDYRMGPVKARTVTVYASFDDGRTWRATPVRKVGATWQAVVRNAGANGYVSLRSRLTTTSGQWTESTVYRAYRLG
ncbi:hypothetical protein [Krasilnikovia sp. MM14-A1259]|uniref:hypothetical protein n=1 Tax=Krasilnikovia sp. MM14-A1259 TaxID=3373539 RepID=UPI00399C72BB